MVEAVRLRVDRAAPPGGGDAASTELRRFYEERNFRPAWSDRRDAAALSALLRAGTHGLDPTLYRADELAEQRKRLDARTSDEDRAQFDVELTQAMLRLAGHLAQGQLPPDRRQVPQTARGTQPDPVVVVERAAQGNPAAEMEAAAPSHPAYANLRHALARLHGIAAAGGWGRVPAGPPLSEGASGARVLALRHRLAATGELPVEQTAAPRFDATLRAAVLEFQDTNRLPVTGTVDEATLNELNVPVQGRIQTVRLNLERWRWMPRAQPSRYLLVNIPTFELDLVEGGRPALRSRIVVGKSWSPTPVFSDEVTSVVLNPVWNVPESITRDEIVPALQRDPGYLARNQMRLFRGDQEVDPASVDWEQDLGRVSVRQDAGDQNALGKIKFMMPNKFDVYLHDTPAGHLFAREERAFSHGCIRVERPLDLASMLLARQTDWPTSRIEEVLATGETTEVKLARPVPVLITYFTAWAEPGGEVSFGTDVYGLDRELASALEARRPDATVARRLLRSEQRPDHRIHP
jgi:murein L,D-transpeptidase YcbB/YkuD